VRNRAVGAIGMAVALVVAAGSVESAHAAIVPTAPFGGFGPAGVVPLTHGHSHNDYDQRRPLTEALSRGYTSIEVDVNLVGGQLLVGHDLIQALIRGRTLRSMYLDPLADWVSRNGGEMFTPGGPGLTLLVDVKTEARSTWRALEAVLTEYGRSADGLLTHWSPDGGLEPGAITVVVSGNRATDLMAADTDRYTSLDGRLTDLDGAAGADLMPLISARWADVFGWRGTNQISDADRDRLRALVEAAHAQGRRIRFFDTPDASAAIRENVWRTELAAGVDLLNVDDLAQGQRFLLETGHARAGGPAASGTGRVGGRT
jgi:hypothetical protein